MGMVAYELLQISRTGITQPQLTLYGCMCRRYSGAIMFIEMFVKQEADVAWSVSCMLTDIVIPYTNARCG